MKVNRTLSSETDSREVEKWTKKVSRLFKRREKGKLSRAIKDGKITNIEMEPMDASRIKITGGATTEAEVEITKAKEHPATEAAAEEAEVLKSKQRIHTRAKKMQKSSSRPKNQGQVKNKN